VTLKVETADGSHGLGDATLNGRELAVVSYLADHVVPALIGRDAHQIEDIWQFLYRGRVLASRSGDHERDRGGRYGTLGPQSQGGGNALYSQLLGGACRRGVRVYGHANGATVEETVAEAVRYQRLGYTAIRLQSGCPVLLRRMASRREQDVLRTGGRRAAYGERLVHAKYLASVPNLFEAARAALGWDIDLLQRFPSQVIPIEAARLGKDLEPYRLVLGWRIRSSPTIRTHSGSSSSTRRHHSP